MTLFIKVSPRRILEIEDIYVMIFTFGIGLTISWILVNTTISDDKAIKKSLNRQNKLK
jgi:hypothetical protein